MSTKITCKCTFNTHGVSVCYPPQSSGSFSGIPSGTVGFIPKVKVTSAGKITEFENSYTYETVAGSYTEVGFASGVGSQLFVGFNGSGLITLDGTSYGALDIGPETVNLQTVTGSTNVISRFQINNNDILVKSPNIADATYAYFETDGMGNFTMRGVSLPGGSGTVTSVDISGSNGIGVSGGPITTSGVISLSLGAITPTSVNGITFSGSGSVSNTGTSSLSGFTGSGTSSGTNTGDQTISLTGEATGSGTGSFAVTLANSAVIGKVLTGLSITGASITSSDTIISAFGKLQNQINGILGGAVYQGVWNANTNSPALASGVGTQGYYYVVSVAGSTNLDGITDWAVGDWAIFNGTAWDKVDNTDAVSSVNGAIGAVVITVTGTTNRVSVSGGSGLTPTIDISSSYVGQSSITTLGTIATGVWQGTVVSPTYGGTGVNNGSNTITLAGNLVTTGAFNTTFAASATATYTLPSATSTLLADNLGLSAGTTLVGGTGATGSITFRDTSNSTNSLNTNHFIWKMTTAAGALETSLSMGNATGGEMNLYSMGNTTQYWLRSTVNASYFNAASDLRLQVAQASLLIGSTTLLTLSKNTTMAAATKFTLAAGTTTVQPLLFVSGTNLTTAVAGSVEYNGTNLFFTRTGTTREYIMVGASGATAPATNTIGVIADYYGTSATRVLTTPNNWITYVEGATTFKIPAYT